MKAWLIAGALTAFASGVQAAPATLNTKQAIPAPNLHALTPAQLAEREVYTQFDENLGEVEGIVVDAKSRKPYVLVKVGGFLGLGGMLIAVPTSDMRLEKERLIITSGVKGKKVGSEYPYSEKLFEQIPIRRPVAELTREPKEVPQEFARSGAGR